MVTPASGTPRHAARRRAVLWPTLGVIWLLVVVSGLVVVARYDNRAGEAAASRGRWPADSRLVRDSAVPTLVMVTHPRCTCTRASLTELAEIMARVQGRIRAYVVFAMPPGLSGDPAMTELWEQASRIPGVSLVPDEDGREATAFAAATSGQIFVYGTSGDLQFSGGTTPARGHPGDNAGRRTIIRLARHEGPERVATPVFGCPLRGPADQPAGPPQNDHEHDHR